MVGATIGAGVGPLEGLHGLVLDALVSVRMVTASGQLVTASDDENGDLFWAVRGAGANFGIITSATYRVHNHTNGGQAVNADFIFPPAANVSLFEVLKSWDDDDVFPQNLGLEIAASFNHTSQLPNLDANFIFYGTQEAAQPYLDKLIALNPLRYQNLTVGWNNLTNVAGFGHASGVCARGDYTTHYSLGANRTDVATFSAFFDNFTAFSAANPWFDGSFALERYNTKAALAVPESERGVYPWRDIKTLVIFENVYPNSSHDAAVAAFYGPVRRAFQAVSGFAVPHVYVNYGYGDEGPAAWYGAHNLPRLSALKRKWDPRGYFGAGNPVPLSWEGEGEGALIR
ncbi:hypothetical protein HO133_000919 [Letharia lupina]|uniref:FAD-binding PCMH-type domain-containing protein n=1 Tax=Letharia lupina TaxID=560253 RepID=A0A8H6CFY7_9LECA|nr:uncharacterized protein HO133_000919 [Letharia lupina]KAF6222868.1 hypothetical protein HO133_000919 [Letharia lupina]